MLAAFVIGFRETFEAALIIGILTVYLNKTKQEGNKKYIWYGCIAGVVMSLLFVAVPNFLDSQWGAINENIFNSLILYSAVSLMTYMAFWMRSKGGSIKAELEQKTGLAIESGKLYSLVFLSFIGVFREGIETVLFMWGVIVSSPSVTSSMNAVFGCFAGGMLAVIFGWAVFHKFIGNFNVTSFFKVTGLLILIIAAGMFSKATGRLIKADIISPIIPQLWDTSWLLTEKGITGKIVSGMTGYISKPSLTEVLSYAGYLIIMSLMVYGKEISSLSQKIFPFPKTSIISKN